MCAPMETGICAMCVESAWYTIRRTSNILTFPMSYFLAHKDAIQENDYFRKEVFTSEKAQITYMKLLPNEDAGESVHAYADHIVLCTQGTGKVVVDGYTQDFREGDLVAIEHGVKHQILNGSYGNMILVSIYTPEQYPRGTAHRTRAEEEASRS